MVESIYIHSGDEFIYLRLFYSFLHLAETIYRRLWGCTHTVCVWWLHYSHSYTTDVVCFFTWSRTILFLLISILFLPVGFLSWELVVRCPTLRSKAPSGPWRLISHVATTQCSRWHVRLQSAKSGGCLATGLQYCYITEARHPNNSKHPFILSSHTTNAKTEENSGTLSLFYQLIMTGVGEHVWLFLKYQGWIRAYET